MKFLSIIFILVSINLNVASANESLNCSTISKLRQLNLSLTMSSTCDYDSECPGIANFCIAGSCAYTPEPGACNSDNDCPGIANFCVAGSCAYIPEPGTCNDDNDCPGIANFCVAGSCAYTPEQNVFKNTSSCQ